MHDTQTVPEPAKEDFKTLQDQMSALMAMMQQQAADASSRMDDLASQNQILADEIAFKDAPSPAATPSKTRFGKVTSSKMHPSSTTTTTTLSRRSNVYFNAPTGS